MSSLYSKLRERAAQAQRSALLIVEKVKER